MKQLNVFSYDLYVDFENLLFSVKNQCDSVFSLIIECFEYKEDKIFEMLTFLKKELENNVVLFDILTYRIVSKNPDNNYVFYLWFYFDVLNYFVGVFRKIQDVSKYVNFFWKINDDELLSLVILFLRKNKDYFDQLISIIFNINGDKNENLLLELINIREKIFSYIIMNYSNNPDFNNIINLMKNLSLILENHIIIDKKYENIKNKVVKNVK